MLELGHPASTDLPGGCHVNGKVEGEGKMDPVECSPDHEIAERQRQYQIVVGHDLQRGHEIGSSSFSRDGHQSVA